MYNLCKYLGTVVIILVIILTQSCTSVSPCSPANYANNELTFSIRKITKEPIDTISALTFAKADTKSGLMIIGAVFDSCKSDTGVFKINMAGNIEPAGLLPPDFKSPDSIQISDTEARLSCPASFCAYNKGVYRGKLVYTNLSSYEYESKAEIAYSEVVFMYADRKVSISGQYFNPEKYQDSVRMNVQHYDLKLNKGWNAICYTVQESNSDYREVSYSTNEIPENAKWIFVKDSNS